MKPWERVRIQRDAYAQLMARADRDAEISANGRWTITCEACGDTHRSFSRASMIMWLEHHFCRWYPRDGRQYEHGAAAPQSER